MAQVAITIRGRQYQIACDDGQEAHLARLGRYLDERAADLIAATGSISEPLLLVMVGLVVADELADAAAEIEALTAETRQGASDAGLASAIDTVTARVEEVAARLEAT
ncbi:MAG: cell division protein ZapA [Rhodospirillaceae bacterium]|nr:MAG: cell division protein ZapA [Rhodospirillaceae bacterium]